MTEMRMTEENSRHVIRMNILSVWILSPLLLIQGVGLGALWSFSESSRTLGIVYAGCVFALLALLIVYAYVGIPRMAARQRIVFGDGTYTITGWFTTRRLSIAEITRVVTINHMALGPAPATHHLVLAGRQRRMLLLAGQMWTTGQLGALANDVAARGVPLTRLTHPVTAVQLRAMDPRLMPWRQAHYLAFALLVAFGTVAVVVTVAVAILAGVAARSM